MSLRARKITLAGVAMVASWLCSLVVAVWVASSQQTAVAGKVAEQAKVGEDHEGRIRALEARSADIAADVRWAKEALVRIETKLDKP